MRNAGAQTGSVLSASVPDGDLDGLAALRLARGLRNELNLHIGVLQRLLKSASWAGNCDDARLDLDSNSGWDGKLLRHDNGLHDFLLLKGSEAR